MLFNTDYRITNPKIELHNLRDVFFFFKLTLSVSSLYFFLVVCIGSKSMLSGLDRGHAKLFPLLGGKKMIGHAQNADAKTL